MSFVGCIYPTILPCDILRFLRVSDIGIERRVFLSGTLIVRGAFAVFGGLCVDAILVLRVFSWIGERARIGYWSADDGGWHLSSINIGL